MVTRVTSTSGPRPPSADDSLGGRQTRSSCGRRPGRRRGGGGVAWCAVRVCVHPQLRLQLRCAAAHSHHARGRSPLQCPPARPHLAGRRDLHAEGVLVVVLRGVGVVGHQLLVVAEAHRYNRLRGARGGGVGEAGRYLLCVFVVGGGSIEGGLLMGKGGGKGGSDTCSTPSRRHCIWTPCAWRRGDDPPSPSDTHTHAPCPERPAARGPHPPAGNLASPKRGDEEDSSPPTRQTPTLPPGQTPSLPSAKHPHSPPTRQTPTLPPNQPNTRPQVARPHLQEVDELGAVRAVGEEKVHPLVDVLYVDTLR